MRIQGGELAFARGTKMSGHELLAVVDF